MFSASAAAENDKASLRRKEEDRREEDRKERETDGKEMSQEERVKRSSTCQVFWEITTRIQMIHYIQHS